MAKRAAMQESVMDATGTGEERHPRNIAVNRRPTMKKGGSMIKGTGVILIFVAMMTAPFAVTAQTDQAFEVTCYANGLNIGTITIFDISLADSACNRTFPACGDHCRACYVDAKLNQVCTGG
jgi:hypothetical protein